MKGENPLLGMQFANERKHNPDIRKHVLLLIEEIQADSGIEIDPTISRTFSDLTFFEALPREITQNPSRIKELMLHSSCFHDLIHPEREKRWQDDTSGLFREEVRIPETSHNDGRVRRAESGYKISLEYLKSMGIDPSKILFFRVTQPATEPKPEYYWSSDFFETQYGLTAEIPSAKRDHSVTLIASLKDISSNGGLIQDINDDNGISVRQIDSGPFDQNKALAVID